MPSAFSHRDYRRYWTGAAISNVGNWMQNMTVPYVLFEITGSGTWVGLSIVAQNLPALLLNPLSGSLADRFKRREVLRVSLGIAGFFAFAQAAMWGLGYHSPTALLVLVGLGGTASLTTQPAWQAMFSDLVPPEDRMSAITLQAAQLNAARAVGPAIGGVVLATVGPTWAFIINGLSFIAVVALLSLVHPPPQEPNVTGRVLSQYRDAIRHARRTPALLVAYALTAVVCGLVYPLFQLVVVFAEEVYDVGPGQYGILGASYGAGAAAGAVALSTLGTRRHRSGTVRTMLAVQAAAVLAFGLCRTYIFGVGLLVVIGAASVCVIALANTTTQTASPPSMRGRMLALWVLSYMASFPVGSVVEGWLADIVGAGPVVTVTGGVLTLIAALFLIRVRLAAVLDDEVPDAVPRNTSPAAATASARMP